MFEYRQSICYLCNVCNSTEGEIYALAAIPEERRQLPGYISAALRVFAEESELNVCASLCPVGFAAALCGFLCNDIHMIFGILIIFEMFAGTAKLADEAQELIDAQRAIVKRFAFKAT